MKAGKEDVTLLLNSAQQSASFTPLPVIVASPDGEFSAASVPSPSENPGGHGGFNNSALLQLKLSEQPTPHFLLSVNTSTPKWGGMGISKIRGNWETSKYTSM